MTSARSFTLVLGGDASVKSAQDVATKLGGALDDHSEIAVDTQTLTGADITTVQTLLAARTKANAQGKSLVMLAPLGEPLRRVLDAGGFLTHAGTAGFWINPSHQTSGA